MRDQYARFVERGVVLLNVGPDSQQAFRTYWQKQRMPFPGLADPKHVAAKQYQQPVRLLKLGRMPMQLIVDEAGVIRHRHEGNGMSDIPSCDELLAQVDRVTGAS